LLLAVNELGCVPLSTTCAELLFEVFSQRFERSSTIITSNLLLKDWTSERLAPAADVKTVSTDHLFRSQPVLQSPRHAGICLPGRSCHARRRDQ
jgi:hypothetical protein